jgi:hypothetical protein
MALDRLFCMLRSVPVLPGGLYRRREALSDYTTIDFYHRGW